MKQFDFYEFTGILAPGALFLAGLIYLWPDALRFDSFKDVSVGTFGFFVLLAYATGHLVQAAGNIIEAIWWKAFGGMPSDWVRDSKQSLLAPAQVDRLRLLLRTRLHLNVPDSLSDVTGAAWYAITRQVYAAVSAAGRAQRIDTFNGNYGLNRGLFAASFVLAILVLTEEPVQVKLFLILSAVAVIAGIRMHRFAKHYARELFVQFLQLPDLETSKEEQ